MGDSPPSGLVRVPEVADGGHRTPENAGVSSEAESEVCVDFLNSISLGMEKGIQKSATFPPPGESRQPTAYERSMSFPPTLKLISAMKGNREKNGETTPTENRHVKWAPDVYDPPITSVSHSVNKNYQKRPKCKKKDKNKQKQKQKQKQKGRSSRGNGNDKKNHPNVIQNLPVLQAPGSKEASTSCDGSAADKFGKHEAEVLDYSISNQEAKCGSSFLRETVAKMHFSTAEAS